MSDQPRSPGYQGSSTTPPPSAFGNGDYRAAEGGSSITGLLRQLTSEVTSLFTKEVALAKAEASESINAAKAGVGSLAAGGAVLLSGFIVLLMSAVYALSNAIAPWLAALIVGGIVVIVGFVMVQGGKKKLQANSFRPDRTVHSMQADKNMVKGARHEH